ncbi:MAG: hypothetical protein KDE22_04175 [Rhodobacterales bacterium]|nr:hypothetical protein [Rhodobacterales bacterium]
MSIRPVLPVLALCGVVGACASQPDDIQTSYVSPVFYKDFDCEQISLELQRVTHRANELRNSLKSTADADAAQMGLGLILFWPALFLLEGGDGAEASEYARLKGEKEALEQAAVRRKCDIQVVPVEADKAKPTPVKGAGEGEWAG